MSGPSPIPPWLHDVYEHSHLQTVILTLAKRERSRDGARAQSRRRSSGSKKDRVSSSLNTVFLAAPSSTSDKTNHYSVAVGNLRENQPGNRYLQLEPYDRTRVVVGEGDLGQLEQGRENENKGRYLNANWVRELLGGKWWIATQAPLPNTAHAFLSVILQPISRPPAALHPPPAAPPHTTRVRTVVQLTPNIERGMNKAHVYFPPDEGQSWLVEPEPGHAAPNLRVTLLATRVHAHARCVQSTVAVAPVPHAGDGAAREHEPAVFQHMLYGAWPDHGVPAPEERAGLLAFVRLVDAVNRDVGTQAGVDPTTLDPDPPMMVGCSAGIGRTGAFIALSSLMRANGLLPARVPDAEEDEPAPPLPPSPLGPLSPELEADPIAREIDSLREQRPGMVQREEQILLVYEALAMAFAQKDAVDQ